jgi:hypothetical protein
VAGVTEYGAAQRLNQLCQLFLDVESIAKIWRRSPLLVWNRINHRKRTIPLQLQSFQNGGCQTLFQVRMLMMRSVRSGGWMGGESHDERLFAHDAMIPKKTVPVKCR